MTDEPLRSLADIKADRQHRERILNERRRYPDRPFDVQPIRGAGLEELDRLRFEQEYLPALVAPDVLEANSRSYEQRLAATKMVIGEENPIPTTLGILVIGKSPSEWIPGAYTQFLRLAGDDLSAPVVDEERIHGTVADQIRRLEEKLAAHNMRGVRFSDIPTEARRETYPMEGLRQLVRNAHMHRSYEATNTPVRVYWFDDRIEIHNPGGPFGSVTPENFGQPGITDYRNPNLAEALRALGYVQRLVQGSPSRARRWVLDCALRYSPAWWLQSFRQTGRDGSHRVFQQQGGRGQDFTGLSLRLHVRRTGLARAGS